MDFVAARLASDFSSFSRAFPNFCPARSALSCAFFSGSGSPAVWFLLVCSREVLVSPAWLSSFVCSDSSCRIRSEGFAVWLVSWNLPLLDFGPLWPEAVPASSSSNRRRLEVPEASLLVSEEAFAPASGGFGFWKFRLSGFFPMAYPSFHTPGHPGPKFLIPVCPLSFCPPGVWS